MTRAKFHLGPGGRRTIKFLSQGDSMEFKRKDLGPSVVVLEMTGKMTMGRDLKRFDEEVGLLIGEKRTRVILDLSGVHFLDSSALGCIVRNLGRLRNSGGSLRLAGVNGMVEGVLKLTHVDKVIEVYPTALDAAQDSPTA